MIYYYHSQLFEIHLLFSFLSGYRLKILNGINLKKNNFFFESQTNSVKILTAKNQQYIKQDSSLPKPMIKFRQFLFF